MMFFQNQYKKGKIMNIKEISLKNYRNIKNMNVILNEGVNVFYGNNAQGKTNILEGIYLCSLGRSQRTRIDKELIMFGEKESNVNITLSKNKVINNINIHLKNNTKKNIEVNKFQIKKLNELIGTMLVVIFSPEDLQLIKSGPSMRRRFLDMEICQISDIYYYNLVKYHKVLNQRNNLLKNIKKDNSLLETLFMWDEQLVLFGKNVINHREEFVNKINSFAKIKHFDITKGKEELEISYIPKVSNANFKLKLEKSLDSDIFMGNTMIGPHKDDIKFEINGENVKTYGSQGQVRSAVLSTKLSLISIIEELFDDTPILLLDDVLSELDRERQIYLLEGIKNCQTILTSTGVDELLNEYVKDGIIFFIKDGTVSEY